MEAILRRRSIRKYTSEPVPDDLINVLLEAAMSAPSAHNEQPWHFIIIRDRKTLDEIPTFHPYAQMLKGASVAIMVCADLNLEQSPGRAVLDCAAATENILIAAQERGLGAVWTAFYPDAERSQTVRSLLEIPNHVIPVALIPVGFPAEEKPPIQRFDPSRIHRDLW
ncbi:MAG: nitroreductase family protein [Desulfitobacteriaceae bacterium]